MKALFLIIQLIIGMIANPYIWAQTSPQRNMSIDTLIKTINEFDNIPSPFYDFSKKKYPKSSPQFNGKIYDARMIQYQKYLKQLEEISNKELTRQEQITKSIMCLYLKDQISEIKYKIVFIPFNAEGGFFNQLTYRLASLPFNTLDDYYAYLDWLPVYASYIEQNRELMREGINTGVVAPKVIVQNMIKLLQVWISKDFNKNPLGSPFLRIPLEINSMEREKLIKLAKEVIEQKVISVYEQLLKFTEQEYFKAANEKVGISNIHQGKAYYEDRVRHYTTLDISPDSVFNLGLQEVKRIRASMEKIIKDLKFEGDFPAFLNYLRTDPKFYPTSAETLLHYAAWLSKKAEGALPKFFINLYSLPFTIEPVPSDIAPYYTGGRYVPGNRKQNKPGKYWVNTYQLSSRPLYTLLALTLHEAVPGHHLQTMKAAELNNIPDFRKSYYISAFGEGWGLYAEYLGEEMGMYTTPYEQFGRYTYEIWRACRLVVDVGMHYKGWTKEQALTFMRENTALSLHEINTEIDRYIGWPGQALSYKIGEIKIKSLRQRATNILGDKFDIQLFHEAVLKNGSVSLEVLEEEIEAYIIATK